MDKLGKFTSNYRIEGDIGVLKMSGAITKDAEFASFPSQDLGGLILHLKAVSYINSSGVRVWMKWASALRAAHPQLPIFIDEVPPFVVRQVLDIDGFFPTNSRVRSVFVPLYCSRCDLDDDAMLVHAAQITDNIKQSLLDLESEIPKCTSCSGKMEFDVIHNDYFRIFKADFSKPKSGA